MALGSRGISVVFASGDVSRMFDGLDCSFIKPRVECEEIMILYQYAMTTPSCLYSYVPFPSTYIDDEFTHRVLMH